MLRYAFPLVMALAMTTPALACEGDNACCSEHQSAATTTQTTAQSNTVKVGEARQTFKVSGMVCAGCAKKITKALTLETGVVAADVNAETGEATVTYLKDKTTEAKLIGIIEKTGFKVDKHDATRV